MTPLFDPDALECLAAIVEEGGFERAAQRLSITQSAVSQRLRALEAQVGTVLLVRSRPIKPTPAGQLLIKHAKMLRLLRVDLEHDLRELAPTLARRPRDEGRISVAINADSIASWALPAITPLVQDGVPLEIIHDDQDFTHEWLREGQVMGCVTTLAQPLRGCRLEPLGRMAYVAVASPAFASTTLQGRLTRHNFHRVTFVAFNRKDDLQRDFVCHAFGLTQVRLQQCYVPSSEGQVRAARAGWGVTVVPRLVAQSALDEGTLVDVCPDARYTVPLYWHCWNLASDVLARLTQALRDAAAAALEPL
ncbi:LysR family transcriptional regulator ArgP [Tepidimonas charontis]|uniref:Putative HTH-type transcriptional regulator n=1 Tax=Tepidimonas charontis TaxID=2267262 RepID=A0A554XHL6_9BURK|nr:LysR family transcriptional regulator ArgP [Tepidimonas charontis]TSE35279.1 putative HTH-type transcriptional regulator [Tepidimonas charontis]